MAPGCGGMQPSRDSGRRVTPGNESLRCSGCTVFAEKARPAIWLLGSQWGPLARNGSSRLFEFSRESLLLFGGVLGIRRNSVARWREAHGWVLRCCV